jgi:hypothetical protein
MNYSIISNLEKCSILSASKNSFANTTKTFFRIQPFNATTMSSLIYKNATAYLRNQPTKTPSITFPGEDEYILTNLSSSLFKIVENQSQQAKAQTLDANYSQMNTMNFYIIISIIGSIIGLFIGLLSGFIIKANYSKKLTNFISNKFSTSKNCQNSIKKKEMKPVVSKEITNSELELAVEDIIVRERSGTSGHAANLSSRNKTNLECISRSSNSDESFGSTKSTSCCNENCVHNRSTSGSTNSERVSDVAVNNTNPPLDCTYIKEKEDYFTIQNDYDNYVSKSLKFSQPSIQESKNASKKCDRFSSLSSTDSSSYGLYNVAHHQNNHLISAETSKGTSQTCLLPSQKIKMYPKLGANGSVNKNPISFIENDYSNVYGKATLPPPPSSSSLLIRQQQQPSHSQRPKDNINKRFSSISFSSTGAPDSIISSAHTVITPNYWGAPSSTMSRQDIYYKNHHIRKQNSVYRPDSTSLKTNNSTVSSKVTNDQKLANMLIRVNNNNNNLIEDGIKKVNINDIVYKNNSYV